MNIQQLPIVKKVRKADSRLAHRMVVDGDGLYILTVMGKNHDADVAALKDTFFFDYEAALDDDADVHTICTPYHARTYEMPDEIKQAFKFFKKTIGSPVLLIEMEALKRTGPCLFLPAFKTYDDLLIFRHLVSANYQNYGHRRTRGFRFMANGRDRTGGQITMLDVVRFREGMS